MPTESVKESTLSGMRWLALKSVMGEGIALSTAVILARLVPPEGFGRAAVALLFVPLAVIMTFEGFASALVQRESITAAHREVAVLMSLGFGAAVSGALLASVPLLWRPIFGSETANLVALVSPVFVIVAVGTVARAALWRRLDFRLMTAIDLAANFVGSVVAVTLAASGLGAKAIVIGAVAGAGVGSLLMLVAAGEPFPRWHRDAAREIRAFGLPASLSGMVGVLIDNVDYWILAARLTAFQTGIYYRAFNLGVVYQSKLSNVMMQIAFPVYSRISDRDEMRALHERAARVHAAVIFPLLASLIVLAPLLVPFVFGEVWEPAVVPAQLLAVAGMIVAVLTGYPQVMLAVGRPRVLLKFNLVVLAVYAAAVAIAVGHGLVAVSIAVVVVQFLILLAAYRFLLGPQLGITISRLIPGLGPALAGCMALLAVCVPLRIVLETGLPDPLTIVIVGLAGVCVYALVLRILFPSTWNDLVTLLGRVVPRRGGRGSEPTTAPATVA